MRRRRSTSFSQKQIKQNLCDNDQHDPTNSPTSKVYNQGYRTQVDNDRYYANPQQNINLLNYHSIPSPHRNNLKLVNSPLPRPRSPTKNDISESAHFDQESGTKMVNNNRKKKTKTVNISNK